MNRTSWKLLLVAFVLFGSWTLNAQNTPPAGPDAAGARTTLEDFLEAKYPVERAVGEGVIRGVVRAANGREVGGPVAGVEIWVRPVRDFTPLTGDLDDRLRALITSKRFRDARTRVATTDASGRYEFDDLPDDARYVVRFTENNDGYVGVHATRAHRSGASVESEVDLIRVSPVERELLEIPARVLDRGERVTEPVQFRVQQDKTPGRIRGWSGNTVRVQPGGNIVTARYRDLASLPAYIEVGETVPAGIELELEPRTILKGWHPGRTVNTKNVYLVERGHVEVGAPASFAALFTGSYSWSTSLVEFTDIEPGEYDCVLTDGDEVAHVQPVAVKRGFNFVRLEIPQPPSLTLQVTFPEPRPQNIKYRFEVTIPNPPRANSTATVLNTKGDAKQVTLPLSPTALRVWSGSEEGTLRVHVIADGLGSRIVPIAPGQMHAELNFDPAARVQLVAPGYLRSAAVGALRVKLVPVAQADRPQLVRPLWTGIFPELVLSPGKYRLQSAVVRGEGRNRQPEVVEEIELELTPGSNEVIVPIP